MVGQQALLLLSLGLLLPPASRAGSLSPPPLLSCVRSCGQPLPWALISCPDYGAAPSSVLASLSPTLHTSARKSSYMVSPDPKPSVDPLNGDL